MTQKKKPASTVLDTPAGTPINPADYENHPWGELLCLRTANAREELAKHTFDLERINALMEQAATEGYSFVRIPQDTPISLRETKAAEALTKTLKAQQITVAWKQASFGIDQKDNELGEAIEFEQLRLSW